MTCNGRHTYDENGLCEVENCHKPKKNGRGELCSMHSARMYRNGTLEKVRQKPYRRSHSSGYFLVNEPDHPLAQPSTGLAFEHRVVYYDKVSKEVNFCELCGCTLNWRICHIDHINENKKDNRPENLQPLCGSCNAMKSAPITKIKIRERSIKLTALGRTMTIKEWVDSGVVEVSRATIQRRLDAGHSDHDALFSKKLSNGGRGFAMRS